MSEREIWMGKLMKYVEEMQKEWINICRPRFQEYYLVEMALISKHYWLIKWLVENDKIDYQKSPWEIMFDDLMWTTFSLEDSIVMMLSISDTPIDDLISYLK